MFQSGRFQSKYILIMHTFADCALRVYCIFTVFLACPGLQSSKCVDRVFCKQIPRTNIHTHAGNVVAGLLDLNRSTRITAHQLLAALPVCACVCVCVCAFVGVRCLCGSTGRVQGESERERVKKGWSHNGSLFECAD